MIFVVILSWNGQSDTIACLGSLLPVSSEGVQVVLVDNGSTDDTVSLVKERFPELVVIENRENLGWAGGNNVGIRYALSKGAEAVVLLNNDTLADRKQMAILIAGFRALPNALLHPRILYFDEPEIEQLGPTTLPKQQFPSPGGIEVIPMSFAYGACLLVPGKVFNEIGLLDERLFLQLEETDFYLRCIKKGISAYCVPGATIYHKESRSFGSRRAPLKTYYGTRNSLLLLAKHYLFRKGFFRELRYAYWRMTGSMTMETGRSITLTDFLSEIHAGSTLQAVAVRQGIADFLLRRFGRASPETIERLSRQ